MRKVTLETQDGRFVADGLIPPFMTWPEVLFWGERVFIPKATVMADPAHEELTYREAFCSALVTNRDGSPMTNVGGLGMIKANDPNDGETKPDEG